MRTIYLNERFECSVNENEETVLAVETDFFDGKSDEFIQCYRYLPEGYSWKRNDGAIFKGLMVAPFKEIVYGLKGEV